MDSIVLTVPVSSPLHPQSILPCLQGFFNVTPFKMKTIDTNILFFWHLLGQDYEITDLQKFAEDPIKVLKFYNETEDRLAEKSTVYDGCFVGLRNVRLKYNRIDFADVRDSLYDNDRNPFIRFYTDLIDKEVIPENPKIVGISVTFQDQIIAAFTLARLIREKLPQAKIVLGGQIITRCHDTLHASDEMKGYWDYLVLWEGEVPLLDIHEAVINQKDVQFINVLENGKPMDGRIDRRQKAVPTETLAAPDFSSVDYDKYLFGDLLIPLQTSRSCYAKCEFCAIPFGANASFRAKSHIHVLEQMLHVKEHIKQKYNRDAVYFKFMDDTTAPKLLFGLAQEIEKRKLNIKWETFTRLDKTFATEGFMDQLYRGGCRKLCWGLESNDPGILQRMNKNNTNNMSTEILHASAKAGVLNFCFVLVGFPGETQEHRDKMTEYIIHNPDIHVLTISTFDLTKFSPMHEKYTYPNMYGIYCEKPKGFEVRLPYILDDYENWKEMIISQAHIMLLKIMNERPDIGLMTLFPDQIRMIFCDKYGNDWGRTFVKKFDESTIRRLMAQTEDYLKGFQGSSRLDISSLPEPLQREHDRQKEDLEAIIKLALGRREQYNFARIEQV